MAVITQIEVANLLTEGYGVGGRSSADEWSPLYRGVTLQLRGQSTAIQINNGDGKSTITQSCLYLLSRDKRLRENVMSLCAPSDKGWTHVRIEFGEKTPGEGLLQSDLITQEADEFPGKNYVIGMCWNRDIADPHFYLYQGALSEAPVYEKTESGLALVSNDVFKKSMEKMNTRARWNKWGRTSDWHEEIKLLMDMAMVRQNVEFQLKGAGDASAMLKEIKQEDGESFDAAFFRQAIAPELLKDTMGAEGGNEETHFEDTLLKSLLSAANSTTAIAKTQSELEEAEYALKRFEPVLDRAHAIIDANGEYEHAMDAMAMDAAILHILVERYPVTGVPVLPTNPIWRNHKRLLQALSHLVIDKRDGVLVTDEGLAELIGINTGKLNEATSNKHIAKIVGLSQVIEIKGDIKKFAADRDSDINVIDLGQVIDFKGDIKASDPRGGRRKDVSYYSPDAALLAVTSLGHYQGANVEGLEEVLRQAFGIAAAEIDTNAYRHARDKLSSKLTTLFGQQQDAENEQDKWQKAIEELVTAEREAQENQVAFEDFAARKKEFPEDYWAIPTAAKKWAQAELQNDQKTLQTHIGRIGELKEGHRQWKTLTDRHAPVALDKALFDLIEKYSMSEQNKETAQQLLVEAKDKQRRLQVDLQKQTTTHQKLTKDKDELERLRKSLPTYEEIFGDVDPSSLDPRASVRVSTKAREESSIKFNDAKRKKNELSELLPMVDLFNQTFGNVNPTDLNPAKMERDHLQKINAVESNIALLQDDVDSLLSFRDRHPTLTPDEWLSNTEAKRIELHTEKGRLTDEIDAWQADLENFDKYAFADNRVYSKALAVLDAKRIPYQRLHTVITAASEGARRGSLLTLFSSALSAPVLKLEDALAATEVLEREHATVPVFLADPLKQFTTSGEVKNVGELSHTFLVGRRTRQVETLLNPELIKEEKSSIKAKIVTHQTRQIEIARQLKIIAESGDLVAEAMRARSAISHNAEVNLAEANSELGRLNDAYKEIAKRASKDSLAAITAKFSFIKNGGDLTLTEVTQKTIPALEREIEILTEQIAVLERQSTGDALRALEDAKKYRLIGGEEKYSKIMHELLLLEPEIEILAMTLKDISSKIETEIEGSLDAANKQLSTLLQTYAQEKSELQNAIAFEDAGYHIFMANAVAKLAVLEDAFTKSQRRLVNINFERAASYIDNKNADRGVADRMAQAREQKNNTQRIINDVRQKIADISGRISILGPYVEQLHELAFELLEKASRLSNFSEDVRQRMLNHMGSHPDMQKYGEIIRHACLGDSPGTSETIKAAIANLRGRNADLHIDTKQIANLKNAQRLAQRDFQEKRSDFCEKARSKEIKGLNELEIAKIEAAKTVEELEEIRGLRDLIRRTIDERNLDLQKAKDLAHASKDASIKNMTRFARMAERNLKLLDRVMKKSPRARFFIEAQIADEEHIRRTVESLLADIEDRERLIHDRANAATNVDIARRRRGYRELVQQIINKDIFIEPKVDFSHAGMWNGDRKAFNDKLSMGQKTALHLMWLIKQAEFSLLRAVYQYGTKKEREAAIQNSQHILFFDGLFSNLSNEKIIDEAFEGLKYVGDAFQLVGLIHNTRYVNNKEIFPVHLIGRRFQKAGQDSKGTRGFVTVEPWQSPGNMGVFTSIFKKKSDSVLSMEEAEE